MTDNFAMPDGVVLATKQVAGAHRPRIAVGDDISGAAITITDGHHDVHDETAYHAGVVDIAMLITEYIGVSFTTPPAATARVHLFIEWGGKAIAHIELLEAPTLANGSTLVSYNRARFSGKTTAVTDLLSYDSTGIDTIGGGTQLWAEYGFASFKTGSRSSSQDEWVLAPSTSYAVKLTADANANAGQVDLTWYEHPDVFSAEGHE